MEIPRESVRLMAESTGLELSDEVAALLAEDVCYRLREATQVCTPHAQYPQLSPGLPPPTGLTHRTGRAPALCFEGIQWGLACPSQGSPSCRQPPLGVARVLLTAAPLGIQAGS